MAKPRGTLLRIIRPIGAGIREQMYERELRLDSSQKLRGGYNPNNVVTI
jgi:hypothetical protein